MVEASTIPTLADVAQAACQYFGVSLDDLRGGSRLAKPTVARQVFYYLAGPLTYETWECIGAYVDRDHSTVYHGRRRIAELIKADEVTKHDVDAVGSLARQLHSERACMSDREDPIPILGGSVEAPVYARLFLFIPGVMQEVRFPYEVESDEVSGLPKGIHRLGLAADRDDFPIVWTQAAPVLIVRLLENDGSPAQ